jgi:hypothetical protein
LEGNSIMLNDSSFDSNGDFHKAIVSISDYYGANTAEVVKIINNHYQPGQVKCQGGVVWRAISTCELFALIVGQRVRIVDRSISSLLLVVEPIALALPEHSFSKGFPDLAGIKQKSITDRTNRKPQ